MERKNFVVYTIGLLLVTPVFCYHFLYDEPKPKKKRFQKAKSKKVRNNFEGNISSCGRKTCSNAQKSIRMAHNSITPLKRK